jgi:hypothetical protein
VTHVLERSGQTVPLRRMRSHPVVLTGVALVLAATAVRGWLLARTWFYLDDVVLVNDAAHDGLTPAHAMDPYFGHLMPAGRALAWLVVQAGPMNYPVAVAELLLLFAGLGLAMLHLLVTLFGPRKAILPLLVYLLFSPFLISAMEWWCVGINHVPALLGTCMAIAAHVRFLRDGRRKDLVASVLWVLFGLAFAELTLFVYLPMLVITAGYFATGKLGERVSFVWDTYRPAVLAHVMLGIAYLGLYLQTSWDTMPSSEAIDWSRFIGNAALNTFPIGAIGGPGAWHTAWAAQFEVNASGLVRLISYAVVATVVSLSALTRDRAMRAWLIPILQLALSTVLVAKARVLFGPGIALDVRFFAPLALGIALALGLAFLPVEGARESSSVRAPHWLVDRPAPVVAATLAFALFATSSAAAFPLRHLGQQGPEPWYHALEKSLDRQGGPVDLVPATVPTFVLYGPDSFYEQSMAQYVRSGQVRFPEVVQDEFYVVDDSGQLVRPDLAIARSAAAPAPRHCGYPIGAEGTVPLDGPVLGFGWRLRFSYTAERDTSVTISLGDVDTDAELQAGTHVLEIKGDAEYDGVRFSGVDPASELCVSSLVVGSTQVPGRPPA